MKKFLIVFFIFLFSAPALALKEYYSISRSVRALGMGNTFYGLSDDEYALFYNPAGLSLYRGKWKFMLPINAGIGQNAITKFSTIRDAFTGNTTVASVVSKLESLQGDPFSASAGFFPHYFQKNFAVGLLLADTKMNYSLTGAGVNSQVEVSALSDSGLLIGYGREFFGKGLHVGLTSKLLFRAGGKKTYDVLEIAQNNNLDLALEQLGGAGGGIDFDLGAIYELPTPFLPWVLKQRFALSINNLLATSFSMGQRGTPPQLPRYISLGSSTVFEGWGPFQNFIFLLDLAEFGIGGQSDPELGARSGSFWKHVNLGLELPIGMVFTLRTGLHQGLFTTGLRLI